MTLFRLYLTLTLTRTAHYPLSTTTRNFSHHIILIMHHHIIYHHAAPSLIIIVIGILNRDNLWSRTVTITNDDQHSIAAWLRITFIYYYVVPGRGQLRLAQLRRTTQTGQGSHDAQWWYCFSLSYNCSASVWFELTLSTFVHSVHRFFLYFVLILIAWSK